MRNRYSYFFNPKQDGVPALPFKDGVKLNLTLQCLLSQRIQQKKTSLLNKISKLSYNFYEVWIRDTSYELRVAIYELRTTSYELRVTSYVLRITSAECRVTSYESQFMSYNLRVTSYELRDMRYELRVTSYKLRVTSTSFILWVWPFWICWLICMRAPTTPTPCHVTYLPPSPTPSWLGQWGDSGVY